MHVIALFRDAIELMELPSSRGRSHTATTKIETQSNDGKEEEKERPVGDKEQLVGDKEGDKEQLDGEERQLVGEKDAAEEELIGEKEGGKDQLVGGEEQLPDGWSVRLDPETGDHYYQCP
jgi:hypothetical protein